MSAIRKMKRNGLRLQYARFCDAWNNEKRYQQYLIETGQPLEEGHAELGRKPTFNMWLQAMKNKRVDPASGAPVAEGAPDPKKVEVGKVDWE